MNPFAILALSFRVTERIPTESGATLDRIKAFEGNLRDLLTAEKIRLLGPAISVGDNPELSALRCTNSFKFQLGAMFSTQVFLSPKEPAVLRIDVDNVAGRYVCENILITNSSEKDLDGIEGDDFIFQLWLRQAEERESTSPIGDTVIRNRPKSIGEAWALLGRATGHFRDQVLITDTHQPVGFYLVSQQKLMKSLGKDTLEIDDTAPKNQRVMMMVAAYLYYSWVVCQRLERLVFATSLNGDIEDERRKMLLARKRLVIGRKYALLKNRAEPGSEILAFFRGVSLVFRLQEQLDNASETLELTVKAIEEQEAFITQRRIKSIEWILFGSSVLGLGVGLNSIQKAPFYYDNTKGKNALFEPDFWLSFVVIAVLATLIFAILNHWKTFRWIMNSVRKYGVKRRGK